MRTHAISFGRRTFLEGGALLATAAGLAGCGKKQDDATTTSTTSGGVLSYDIENPTGIEPYTLEDENACAVAYNLFDSLTFYDFEDKKLVGLVADSWESNDTADTWTFKLKEGTTFHDGSKVTSSSFKYGWERLCDPKTAESPSALSYHLSMVMGYDELQSGSATSLSGVTCPDDTTLVVKLSQPYADFPFVCSAPVLSPIPDCAKDDYKAYALSPVGNGPFKMKGSWEDGQYVELQRFDDYQGDKPIVDGAMFTVFRDSQTAYKELQAGSLDCSLVPASQTKDAVSTYGEATNDGYTAEPTQQVLTGTMFYTQYLVMNVQDPVISDIRVRKALGLSVNRQSICDSIYEGSAKPAGDLIPESIEGSDQSIWADSAAYDVEKAGKLLDEAGYPLGSDGRRGLAIELMTNSANPREEYEAMQGGWDELGIDVTINRIEYAAMLENYLSGSFQVAARGWYADYPIQDNYLYPLFSSASSDNMSHFADDTFDKMILDARAITDHDKRVSAMADVDRYVASLVPVVPLNYKSLNRATASRVHDLTVTPQILPYLNKAWLTE